MKQSKLLGLRRIEYFPKPGTLELSLASEQKRYTLSVIADAKMREAGRFVSDHVDLSAILDNEKRRFRASKGDVSEEVLEEAGLTLDKIEQHEIRRNAERLAREYADEFAYDLEKLVLRFIEGL